jgi:ABC-type nickel/cobalt efflux system permease component RcnA
VGSAVTATVDGQPVALTPARHSYPPADLLAAAGGPIALEWTGVLPADARQLVVADRYAPGERTTVQMSVLVPPDPVPLGRIGHADGGGTMTVALNPAMVNPGTDPQAAPAAPAPAAGSAMLDALRRPLTSPWALLALVGACGLLGALHALTPGHGKTLLAAYLVGDRGTPREAVALGITITITHTAAVLALGTAVLAAGRWIGPGVAVPLLTVGAGVAVLVLGLRLVRRRWSAARSPDHHTHIHDGPREAHDHGHGHGHGHVALLSRPAGLRGIATMGASAGVVPCPEAFGVLLLAVGLHRTGLGLVMIVAFSVGLGAVLVVLGLLLVTAAPVLSRVTGRRSPWVTARLPLLSAVVVAVLGAAMTMTGLGALAG